MERAHYLQKITEAFSVNPVVGILGPRQCGKTTLAKQYTEQLTKPIHFFDLEDPDDLSALENPKFTLESLNGLIVIDEIQRRPELFPYLRSYVDKRKRNIQILVLGSASRDLIQQSSETLAGRISYIELTPFNLSEVPVSFINCLWERGGYPLSYLSDSDAKSYKWRTDYISTYLERDLPQLGIRIPSPTIRRFWQMLTHYQGQIINYSELSKSFGVSDSTVRNYLDILTETFMVKQLKPWHENIKKRQVKRPKLYFRDSGIYHALLTVETKKALLTHPKLGASWESFALEQITNIFNLNHRESYFWSVHNQGELDLFFQKDGKRYGVEFKFSDKPILSKSMVFSKEHLKLDYLYCIYPGDKIIKLAEQVFSCGLKALGDSKSVSEDLLKTTGLKPLINR